MQRTPKQPAKMIKRGTYTIKVEIPITVRLDKDLTIDDVAAGLDIKDFLAIEDVGVCFIGMKVALTHPANAKLKASALAQIQEQAEKKAKSSASKPVIKVTMSPAPRGRQPAARRGGRGRV